MSRVYKERIDVGLARPYRYKVADGRKDCSLCHINMVVSNFRTFKASTIDGKPRFASWCYDCERGYYKERHLNQKYNLTVEDYAQMVTLQGGGCYICSKVGNLVVDHDHKTGQVRKLLCDSCNTGLGHFRESITIMEAAIKYLTEERI